MKLKQVKKSENVVDKTSQTPVQQFLDKLFLALNPVHAGRKAKGKMIEKGWIDAPQTSIFGPTTDIRKDAIFRELMTRDSLINPDVVWDDHYGDLIPYEERMDKNFPNRIKPMRKKK